MLGSLSSLFLFPFFRLPPPLPGLSCRSVAFILKYNNIIFLHFFSPLLPLLVFSTFDINQKAEKVPSFLLHLCSWYASALKLVSSQCCTLSYESCTSYHPFMSVSSLILPARPSNVFSQCPSLSRLFFLPWSWHGRTVLLQIAWVRLFLAPKCSFFTACLFSTPTYWRSGYHGTLVSSIKDSAWLMPWYRFVGQWRPWLWQTWVVSFCPWFIAVHTNENKDTEPERIS